MNNLVYRLNRNIANIPGWSTRRKIVVFESDDWGSIRVRSNEDTEAMEKEGFSFKNTSFYRYDSLESNDDLTGLFEILCRHKDKQGNHPIFTLVSNVANPVFDKIEQNGYQMYFWEPFTDTLKRYSAHDKVFMLHKEGITNRLTYPVFHGREHLNVQRWLRLLQQGNKSMLIAFKHGSCSNMYGINNEYIGALPAAFDLDDASDLEYQHSVIQEGLMAFEKIWDFKARYFVSPNGPFNNSLEKDLFEGGIEYVLGERIQKEPLGNRKYRKNYRYIGKKNGLGQVYLTRNGAFEPGILEGDLFRNAIEKGMKAIERAFRWNKPAILSTHRINYLGFLNPQNRKHGLSQLDIFLKEIIKRWPNVEFLTSVELGDLITNKNYADE